MTQFKIYNSKTCCSYSTRNSDTCLM